MKRVAVIGLGEFGSQISIALTQKGFDVVGIDDDEDVISEYKDIVAHVVSLDSTDEKAMRGVSVDTVDVAVVAIGSNVQSSLLSVALLQKLGVEEIYVRAINSLQESILRSMGINHIINIEEEMGKQLAASISLGRTGRYVQISERHSLTEVAVPGVFVGKTLKDLNLRSQFRVNIVGIKQQLPEVDDDGEVRYQVRMMDIPDPEYPLCDTDVLVILGTDETIQRFSQLGADGV